MNLFDNHKIIPAPSDPADWQAWRESLHQWRDSARSRFNHDPSLYNRPEFEWLESCFAICLAMLCDQTLFDPQRHQFTPETFLELAKTRFGGFDAIVLWHAYPNIGFDDRNQFDYYRDAPNGLEGLRQLTRAFRAQGVRSFINYNPWDTFTRREPNSDLETLAKLVQDIEADGIFLDTMRHGSSHLRTALDAARPGVALESESSLPLERICDHPMSWAQWYPDTQAPGVLRNRWFEQRHVMHQTQRWQKDHSHELHTAFMNGTGMLIWENVFGSYNGWNARDSAILRIMRGIQQRYAQVFSSGHWTPLVFQPTKSVYASRWQLGAITLWTLINRAENIQQVQLELTNVQNHGYYDLVNGTQLHQLEFSIQARGIGAVVLLEDTLVNTEFKMFLENQALEAQRWTDDTSFPELQRQNKKQNSSAITQIPADMVKIPESTVTLVSTFRNRECGTDFDPAFIDIWKPLPPDLHNQISVTKTVTFKPYALDTREVSNAQFAIFLAQSGYRPEQPHNFLKYWENQTVPLGLENQPVVWIDQTDAEAYATWVGKRLPTEDEWQYGIEQHNLPYGQVWNWTANKYSDGRTGFTILKGGSWYIAKDSPWYADGGKQEACFAAKFLLFHAGLNRQATIGFRLLAELN